MAKKKDENLTPEERAYKNALETHLKELKKISAETEKQSSFWESIAYAVTDISKSQFFVNIKRTSEDISRMNSQLEEMNVILKETGEKLNNSFQDALNTIDDISEAVNVDLRQDLAAIASQNAEMAMDLTDALYMGDISTFFAKWGQEGMKAFQKITKDKDGFKYIHDFLHTDAVKDFGKINDQMKRLLILSKEESYELFSWRKTLSYIGENIFRNFTPIKLLAVWHDFDQIINETQRDFGISMDKNASKFSTLVTESQIFGMGAKENAALMGQLAEELRSTDFDLLNKAAKSMSAIHRATGLSVQEVGELGKQMMFFGRSSETVRDFTEDTMQKALRYGLSTKKVLQEITKALPDARRLGWAGGEKALRDMVLQAQKLGQTLEGLAGAAKKLRTLEGSLEAAADLALVGVNTNAIQMLGAARRGGKEFANFVADLTKDIGTLKSNGEIDFSPVDIDRLQIVADATGLTLDDLQNQIAKTAQRNKKIELLPSSLFGANLSEEEKEFLLNAAQIGKDGTTLKLDIGGVKDITKLTPEILRANIAQKASLEEAAKNNQSFNESLSNLTNTIKALFTYVQPIIEEVTRWVQGFNNMIAKLPESAKKMTGIIVVGLGIFFTASKHFFSGYWYGQGFNAAVNRGGFLSGLGKMLGKLNPMNWTKAATTAASTTAAGTSLAGAGAGAGGAARGVGAFGNALNSLPSTQQILAISAALVALGVAFVGIGYGIKLAASGLTELVGAFDGISNAGVALGAVAVVMGGFAGMLALMIPLVSALGTAGTFAAPGLLALGVAFVGIGAGVWLATKGISVLVKTFGELFTTLLNTNNAASNIASLSFALLGVAPALIGFGAAGFMSAPGITAMSIALGLLTPILALATPALVKLSSLKFDFIRNLGSSLKDFAKDIGSAEFMGVALTSLILPMIKFSAVGLFAVPIMLASKALLSIGGALSLIVPAFASLSTVNWDGFNVFANSILKSIPGLISFAGLGLLAIPISAGIAVLGLMGMVLPKFVQGLQTLKEIDISGLQNINKNIQNFIPGFLGLSAIGLLAIPFIKGAAMLATGAKMLEFASFGITKFLLTDWTKLKDISSPVNEFIGSMFKMSTLGIIALPLLAGATAISMAGVLLGQAAKGFELFGAINFSPITEFSKEVPGLLITLAKLSTLSLISAPVVAGAAMLATAGIAFGIASKGFNQLASIEWTKLNGLSQNLSGFLSGLIKFAGLGLVSPLLLTAGIALTGLGAGLTVLASSNYDNLSNLGETLNSIIGGITKFSLIGALISPLTLAASSIGIIGTSFIALSKGTNLLQGINWSVLNEASQGIMSSIPALTELAGIGVLSVLIGSGAAVFYLVGKALSTAAGGFKSLSNVNWSILDNANNTINKLSPIFSEFGAVSIKVSPQIEVLSSVMSNLAEVLEDVAEPLNVASKSLYDMSVNTQKVQSSIQSIDTSKLNALSNYSENIINSQSNKQNQSANTGTSSASQKVTFDPIVINLKLNGRDVQEIIVKDTAYSI